MATQAHRSRIWRSLSNKRRGLVVVAALSCAAIGIGGYAATTSTEAALAAYPGGVVDRVVQVSNGEYEVHYIGVNWPHHIFVNQAFQVVGAD